MPASRTPRGLPGRIVAALALIATIVATALATAAAPPALAAAPSVAAASPWAETDHGKVRLIAAVDGVGEGTSVPLGLEFVMAPGWKIYWRSPGDAGFPPEIDWSGSANLAGAGLSWPAPRRFTVLGFETVGYEDHVILPIDARLETPATALALAARVDYLTCKDICVPYTASLALDLPAGPVRPSAFAPALDAFAARVPTAAGTGGSGEIVIDEVGLSDGAPPRLVVRARSTRPFASPDVFVEAPAGLAFEAPEVEIGGDGASVTLRVAVAGGEIAAGTPVTLTLVDGDRAVERRVALTGAPVTPPLQAPVPVRSFGLSLLFALLGGLILNMMPCVLPVLSMKLLAVVGHGGGDRRRVRLGFLASAAGIGASFLVLAAALIGLQAAGAAAGWGLQFQRPWFLTAMTLVMTLFACNLWGWFEIPLPAWLGTVGGGAQGAGRRAGTGAGTAAGTAAHGGGGLAGHFLAGALATLLATPCSAPFLGTAIGFALAAGPAQILVIFAAIAVGLALPYLVVALFPALATRLPRPGPWMVWLRRVLGFALLATGAWLASVLAAQAGAAAALALVAICIALIAVLGLAHRRRHGRWHRLAPAAAAVLALAAFLVPHREMPVAAVEAGWQRFEPDRIAGLVAAGRIVYVNVTADWCLTCKVNESVVLARDPVRSRLQGSDVIAMRGDWTRPDEGISRFLAGFGRYGIPFDAVYGPGLPSGEALPELLTSETVLDALGRATRDRVADAR
ncbi:MAG: protein-disulfide reductase DsbD family protein [Rhodospirillales bacterium]